MVVSKFAASRACLFAQNFSLLKAIRSSKVRNAISAWKSQAIKRSSLLKVGRLSGICLSAWCIPLLRAAECRSREVELSRANHLSDVYLSNREPSLSLSDVWSLIRPYWFYFLAAVVSAVLAAFVNQIPLYLGYLIDKMVQIIIGAIMNHYIFLSICLLCLSVPLLGKMEAEGRDESTLTIENLDSYFDMMKMFRGMLPKDLMSTIDSLNITEKRELVAFLSDWYHGRIKKPENKDEVIEVIKDKLPTLYEKIDALNTTFYEKFLKLKPETQQLLRSWRDKAVELEGETAAESAAKQLQFLRDVALSVQTMNNETKEDIRSQFPLAVNLTEGFVFTVLATMMIVQKVMESFGAQGAATVAPQDCAVPLD